MFFCRVVLGLQTTSFEILLFLGILDILRVDAIHEQFPNIYTASNYNDEVSLFVFGGESEFAMVFKAFSLHFASGTLRATGFQEPRQHWQSCQQEACTSVGRKEVSMLN